MGNYIYIYVKRCMMKELRWDVMYLGGGTERKIGGSDVRKRW
jgi:hypothetical protein